MPRHTDGSLMTKEKEKEENIRRLHKAIALGNLMNTGPVEDGRTSFSPNRWDSYFSKHPEEAPVGWTGQDDVQEKMDSGVDVTEELFGYELLETPETFPIGTESDGKITYEYMGQQVDEDGKPIEETDTPVESVQSRNLQGNRDKDGNLMAQEIAQDIETEKTIEADTYAGENEFDTTVEGWITEFKALSEEDFRAINNRDLKELGLNAIDAYYEVLDIHDAADDRQEASLENEFDWQGKAKGPPTDEERDTLIQDDVAREDDKLEEELSSAELDQEIMEAESDTTSMEDKVEKRDFPMMNLSDEDKGMFTFKKTESKDEKTIGAGIGVIVKDTGMNEEQARQLMTKLKGICG